MFTGGGSLGLLLLLVLPEQIHWKRGCYEKNVLVQLDQHKDDDAYDGLQLLLPGDFFNLIFQLCSSHAKNFASGSRYHARKWSNYLNFPALSLCFTLDS